MCPKVQLYMRALFTSIASPPNCIDRMLGSALRSRTASSAVSMSWPRVRSRPNASSLSSRANRARCMSNTRFAASGHSSRRPRSSRKRAYFDIAM